VSQLAHSASDNAVILAGELTQNCSREPRNDIEHAYRLATEDQARRALDVADLFIAATAAEAATPAIVALGWNINVSEVMCSTPGKEQHVMKFALTKKHSPMLLINGYPGSPEATIIHPQEETLRSCPLKEFKASEIMKLDARLRECMKSDSYTSRSLGEAFIKALREQLKI
jgi:hypothetical protein